MRKTVSLILVLVLLCSCFVSFADDSWECPGCGESVTGNFCSHCGHARPEETSQTQDKPVYTAGDIIRFGKWGGEAIRWQVMEDLGDGSYILLSVNALDAQKYNDADKAVTWASCSLRKWMNGTFYGDAFTMEEKKMIGVSHLKNPANASTGAAGCEDTDDRIYALSLEEVMRYFGVSEDSDSCEALICLPTQTAVRNGGHACSESDVKQLQKEYSYPLQVGACVWWLRSPGSSATYAAEVSVTGSIAVKGRGITGKNICVRPAMRFIPGANAPAPEAAGAAVSAQTVVSEPELLSVGDTLTLGSWGGEAIDWQIMEIKDDGAVVLLSVKAIDAQQFNDTGDATTWEKCTLRQWLNSTFYEGAFTNEEKQMIQLTHVVNSENPVTGVSCGNDTDDRVFLLSIDEVARYYDVPARNGSSPALICMPTGHAVSNGGWACTQADVERFQKDADYPLVAGSCVWWLRSLGKDKTRAANVTVVGSIGADSGREFNGKNVCVRPAICLDPHILQAASLYAAGDTLSLGSWGGKELQWQVLRNMGDGTYILMSTAGVDAVPYNTKRIAVTWADCSLREWLNSSFLEKAFTEQERSQIQLSVLPNPDNSLYGTAGGVSTEDYVYVLSLEEIGQYFGVDPYSGGITEALICLPGDSAVKNGALVVTAEDVETYAEEYGQVLKEGTCGWWLRSPGSDSESAAFIDIIRADAYGLTAETPVLCVRPVIRVRF